MEFGTKNKSEVLKMACELSCIIEKSKKEPIFLCVGSDTVVSDCFGAIVGDLLINKYNIPARVVGNLNYNVDKNNFEKIFKFVEQNYKNNLVIVVDAALTNIDSLNNIKINNTGCFVAGGFGKGFKAVGEVSILGCVNLVGCNNLMFLKGCKLNNIIKMAKACAEAIRLSFLMPKVEILEESI